jgi:hypothetical protein
MLFALAKAATATSPERLQVGYGANGRFVFEEFTNGTAYNNGVFGDPDYGSVKACFIPGGPLGYSFCSMEGGLLQFQWDAQY